MPSMKMPAVRTESTVQHTGAGQYRGDELLASKRQSIVAKN
jgi:hypothetical protein